MKHLLVKSLVPLAFLGLAGCGVSTGRPAESQTRQGSVTADRQRYIAAADAICRDAQRKADRPGTELGPSSSPQEDVEELTRSAAAISEAVTRIESLQPPPQDVDRLRRGLFQPGEALAARLRDLAGRAGAAMRSGRVDDAEGMVQDSLQPDPDEQALRAFTERYGMHVCSGG